ncbi:hypothetical protein [Streptomyces marianii]|uniref:Uncharacterized protein n=1 Tax=Streptomyces marianii TaxID=1817406 RepID=A0A5R9DY58_9ACTN|nr:hypothetical protein [Streptomyces marianii]TLQ42276.1 hypothetical protein FEF34_02650 [Streptomyces marianii]
MNAIGRETALAPAASCVDAYWLDSHRHDQLSCLVRVQARQDARGGGSSDAPRPEEDGDRPSPGSPSAHERRHPAEPWIVPPGLPPRLPSPPPPLGADG